MKTMTPEARPLKKASAEYLRRAESIDSGFIIRRTKRLVVDEHITTMKASRLAPRLLGDRRCCVMRKLSRRLHNVCNGKNCSTAGVCEKMPREVMHIMTKKKKSAKGHEFWPAAVAEAGSIGLALCSAVTRTVGFSSSLLVSQVLLGMNSICFWKSCLVNQLFDSKNENNTVPDLSQDLCEGISA